MGARPADGVADRVGLVCAESGGPALGRHVSLRGAAEGIADRLLLVAAVAARKNDNGDGAEHTGGFGRVVHRHQCSYLADWPSELNGTVVNSS